MPGGGLGRACLSHVHSLHFRSVSSLFTKNIIESQVIHSPIKNILCPPQFFRVGATADFLHISQEN